MSVSLVVAALFRCTPATSASQPSSHESLAGFGEAPPPRRKSPPEADPELHVDTLLIEEIEDLSAGNSSATPKEEAQLGSHPAPPEEGLCCGKDVPHACRVALPRLLADPQSFDGRFVSVTGYAVEIWETWELRGAPEPEGTVLPPGLGVRLVVGSDVPNEFALPTPGETVGSFQSSPQPVHVIGLFELHSDSCGVQTNGEIHMDSLMKLSGGSSDESDKHDRE